MNELARKAASNKRVGLTCDMANCTALKVVAISLCNG